ncbi:protein FAM83H [Syngnathus scovelli]|uniref:protein FAM83H n=1 Tax=Syngnathus scovelli TaxID=161590 RepID=UPI0021107E96|nr:protein FAM83H [Syngnathus scovelli]XP_049592236.1 protein FAM83H [Syngnathus scovelli]XP_049592237.1 protein FAM83H [Syngnathus scovelli]XP_049592238.1 protein FAM83H [Syngnathus scovelli]
MARRSQCSSAGDNPLHPNYLPPHYREEYRLAIDALIEENVDGYYEFLQKADVVDFLATPEIQYIQSSAHLPQQATYQEQTFLESGGDSSSDTYWPIHSDLDAPGLDLGWPQLHLFGGPTEVTTLVNPPEPDMPSIKEQARRLIKNAQQVIAIVMDMFTDVDIFADILNAAMRNVAVYILLDEQNVHYFMNMVSNCRVNLQSIQFLRVRTVSGITYHCRSGKSFKGQMMDRFLLTDCRAVLSGNYSFMWSFEKLHRCMAHLFLGQLVSTFDEEFRILFAQSQPLLTDGPAAMEDIGLLQKRQYPSKITSLVYREPRKFLPMDMPHADDWTKPSYDEQMETDWRMSHLKRNDSFHGPVDMYSQQGHSKFPMMENPALKRNIYAEGVTGRYNYPFPTQPAADLEARGRLFHRGQQKIVGQNYHAADQYSEPGLPQEMEPFDDFDPVLNYLSSTRNVDFEQVSEKLQPPADLASSLSQPTLDDKQFLQEPNADRKDPMVKRGLRNWRINSFLSAHDIPGDEGLPSMPPQATDPFEEPSITVQPTELSIPKIPNVREFKIPVVPRVSQLPCYAKTFALEPEQSNKLPEESTAGPADTKTTPTPSESSSTTEGEKLEEAEQKEPTAFRKEESFRRKYNPAMPRSSRLRSSLIFNSLEQHTAGQQDDESNKNEGDQTKLPFASQVFGQRRSAAREAFGWTRYLKSFDSSAPEASKQEGNDKPQDKDSSKEDLKSSSENLEVQHPDIEQAKVSPSPSRLKRSESDILKSDQALKSSVDKMSSVDMSDPDKRFVFFKELAAKRKAAKAAEAEKKGTKTEMKIPTHPDSAGPNDGRKDDKTSQLSMSPSVTSTDLSTAKSTEPPVDVSHQTKKQEGQVSNLTVVSQSSKREQPTDLKKVELGNTQTAASLSVSAETETHQCESEDPELHKASLSECSSGHQSMITKETHANLPSLKRSTDKSLSPVLTPTTGDSASSSASNIQTRDSSQVKSNVVSLTLAPQSSKVAQPDAKNSNSENTAFIRGHQSTSIPHDSNIDSPSMQSLTDKIHQEKSVSASSPRPTQSTEEAILKKKQAVAAQDQNVSVDESGVSPIGALSSPRQDKGDVPLESNIFGVHIHSKSDRKEDSSQEQLRQTTSPTDANLGRLSTPAVPDLCSSALVQSVSPTHAESTMTTLHGSPDTNLLTNGNPNDRKKITMHPTSVDTSVRTVPAPLDSISMDYQNDVSKDLKLPTVFENKMEDSERINEPTGQNKCSGTTAEDGVPSQLSKQPKSSQSRYHSSTAGVLSSSNLRDDTKLLLEQISANSQNRNESTKESPVTDDEKEDEADKNAKREKEREIGSLSSDMPNSSQDRDKLLERLQNMRKERKVYSRFDMTS